MAAISLTVIALAYVNVGSSAAGPADEPARSAAAAEALIARENLVTRLETALGEAFGGVWFERSTARLHVGVTSPASRRRVAALAARIGVSDWVTATSVDSTRAQLEAAHDRLNRHLRDLFARAEVHTGLRSEENSVLVELGSEVPGSRREALQREASATGVEVSIEVASEPEIFITAEERCRQFVPDKAHCDKPIAAGVQIESKSKGNLCSSGPAILLQDLSTGTKATETYILTAGHCIKEGGGVGANWAAFTKAEVEKVIGQAKEALRGEKGAGKYKVDVGVIKVESADWQHATDTPVTPGVVPWSTTKEVDPVAVTAYGGLPAKDTMVCVSGKTSGLGCKGKVLSNDETFTVKNKAETESWTVEKLVEVEGGAAGEGTSGGPWVLEGDTSKVLGTHVGGGIIGGKTINVFQPLPVAFEHLSTKYQLLTTGNQKRKHPGAGPPMTASEYPAVLTGSGTAEGFSTEGGEVKCSSHFEGTLQGITTTLTVAPKYTSCLAFGIVEATVNMEGCTFEFHSTEKVAEGVYKLHSDVLCPAGQSIKISAGTCKLELKEQTGLTSVKATNEAGSVKVNPEVTNLAYTVTQDGFLCPFNGTGNKTDGKYNGQVTLSKVGGGSIDITGE